MIPSPPPPPHRPPPRANARHKPRVSAPVPILRAMAIETSAPPASPTASPSASPTGRTLSDAFAEDRRREREARRSSPLLLLPGCGGGRGRRPGQPYAELRLRLHRWGAACLPKASAMLRSPRTPPRTPPRPRRSSASSTSPAQVPLAAIHQQAAAQSAGSVAEKRPLRERAEAAVYPASTPAESQDKAVTAACIQRKGCSDTATTVVRGSNIWVRVSRERSLRVESPQPSVDSPTPAEDKYVWADRYRPSVLKDFICNKAVADELHRMVTEHKCNHFIFEGPRAVGKRSMVMALMRNAFGPDDLEIEEHKKRIGLKGEIAKYIDVKMKISDHHVEVNLADLHGYEKHVITTLLNESIPSPTFVCDHTNCRVIVVHDADRLSIDLQHYIGWFLERYAGCNKIIFSCSDSSNLDGVKHLCKVITLQPPSFDEIIKVLEFIAMQERIDLPPGISRRITASASNNLRQAIRSFEATWKANYPFVQGQPILTGWEEEISNVAKNIMEEPSPKQLYLIRRKIRKMIEHNVSPYYIFCSLITELKRDKDEDFQNSINQLASDLNDHYDSHKFQKEQSKSCKYEGVTTLGTKAINIEGFDVEGHDQRESIQWFIKIEEFTVRFMSFYRALISKNSIKSGVL